MITDGTPTPSILPIISPCGSESPQSDMEIRILLDIEDDSQSSSYALTTYCRDGRPLNTHPRASKESKYHDRIKYKIDDSTKYTAVIILYIERPVDCKSLSNVIWKAIPKAQQQHTSRYSVPYWITCASPVWLTINFLAKNSPIIRNITYPIASRNIPCLATSFALSNFFSPRALDINALKPTPSPEKTPIIRFCIGNAVDTAVRPSMLNLDTNTLSTTLYIAWNNMDIIIGNDMDIRSFPSDITPILFSLFSPADGSPVADIVLLSDIIFLSDVFLLSADFTLSITLSFSFHMYLSSACSTTVHTVLTVPAICVYPHLHLLSHVLLLSSHAYSLYLLYSN